MPQRLNMLARHHTRLAEIAETAAHLVSRSVTKACMSDLRLLRIEMVDALGSYQSFVHHEVFEPAMKGSSAMERDIASALKVKCVELQGSYERFRMRWSHRDARLNWPEYRLSAMQMVKHVRDHIHSTAAAEKIWADGTAPADALSPENPNDRQSRYNQPKGESLITLSI